MRRGISRAERRASRKQISQTAPGIFQLIRLFNRFELIFSLLALGLSVALLFIGTYVYFDSSIQQQSDASEAATTGLTEFYDSILRFYGINTTDFTMLFPVMGDNSLSAQNKHRKFLPTCLFQLEQVSMRPNFSTHKRCKQNCSKISSSDTCWNSFGRFCLLNSPQPFHNNS